MGYVLPSPWVRAFYTYISVNRSNSYWGAMNMAIKQSDAVDQALALEAIAKRKRGEIPSDREQRALNRIEKRQEEQRRWEYYRSIPLKHWVEMSGRERKILYEQAKLYNLGFGEKVINLPTLVRQMHDFLAKLSRHGGKWIKSVIDGDYDAEGPQTESLDRLRTAKAEREEFNLQVLKKKYLLVDEIQGLFALIASGLRQTLDSLQRQFGVEAMNIVREGIEEMDQMFGREIQNLKERQSYVGSELGTDTGPADGDSTAPAERAPDVEDDAGVRGAGDHPADGAV
jgi:hypothetical protein